MKEKLISFKQDLLNRRPLAENLTRVLEKTNDINVIAIDSAWGSGKTTFIQMWQNMIDEEDEYKGKFETLYFNAWENDYIKDPLVALISEIKKVKSEDESKVTQVFNSIVENGKKLIKPALNIPIKLVSNGTIGIEDLKSGNSEEDELKKVIEEKELREKFINELKKDTDNEKCKIIFFIDELDRCRPTFSIELLEVIKHLFKAKNVIFIIAVDKEQLAYSISTLYGQGMDSDGYLRRFFDLEYKMPIINKRRYIESKNKMAFEGYDNTRFLQVFLRELLIRDECSFRDIDKTYDYVVILMPLAGHVYNSEKKLREIYLLVYSFVLAEMINIKMKHNSIYRKIINLDYNPMEEDIDAMLSFDKFEGLKFNIGLYSDKNLIEIIFPIMNMYLLLIKLTDNGENHFNLYQGEEEKFTIGLKNNNGDFYEDYQVDLKQLIDNNDLDLISMLEFMDSFIIKK